MKFKYYYQGEVFTDVRQLLNKILRTDYAQALEIYCANLDSLERENFDPEEDNDLWEWFLKEMLLDEQIHSHDRAKWSLGNFIVKNFGVEIQEA